MRPINVNLDQIVLPTRASSQLTKVVILHDSQGLRNIERWVGQIQKWNIQHVGMMCYAVHNPGVGQYFEDSADDLTGATATRTRQDPESNWGDGNTIDHLCYGFKWDIAGTLSPNFQNLGLYGWAPGGFTLPLDMTTRKNAKVIIRDSAGSFTRVRASEMRDGLGNGSDFDLDGDGSIKVLDREIRAFGSTSTRVGVAIRDSSGNDTNRHIEVLGVFIHNSPSGVEFPTTGLATLNTGWSGWSLIDHVNNQSDIIRDAVVEALAGADLIITSFGHNAESSGDFATNLGLLRTAWNDAHTRGGQDTPDWLHIAPWESTGPNAMSDAIAEATYQFARANNDGFISLWDSYEGATPVGRTERLDGVAATYALDPLHPDDASTAENIAKDIEYHFQPENWQSAPVETAPESGEQMLSRPWPAESKI